MLRRFLAATAAAAAVAGGWSAAPASSAATLPPQPAVHRDTVRLGGVTAQVRPGTRQVLTVNHRTGWHATVRLWRSTGTGWRRVATARDGRTGYGGLVPGDDREQGSGTTPLGSYRVSETFGLARRPVGTELDFHRVRAGDYWVQDNGSRWYNTLRNRHQGGFRWWLDGYNGSERLRDYAGQYRWSIVIDFNRPDPVRHRGSGIFLHVNGAGATAGCVSTPRRFVRTAMQRLDPGKRPIIAIGR